METIRLDNFRCMYINVRFVVATRRELSASRGVFQRYAVVLLVLFVLLRQPTESKKVIIHIPYRVNNVKHTHTVYKIIPHYHEQKSDDIEEDEKYENY
ncbi:hypothetical protein ANTQUA_LOCUS1396 [Anthophora quadrimaculata]